MATLANMLVPTIQESLGAWRPRSTGLNCYSVCNWDSKVKTTGSGNIPSIDTTFLYTTCVEKMVANWYEEHDMCSR